MQKAAFSSSGVRKAVGWVILIPSILAMLFMVLALVVGFLSPGEPVTKAVGIGILIVVTGVPAALIYLGLYLIWLRDRWRVKSTSHHKSAV